uniref:Serine/threonine-protein kinase haspin homolog n=1 Tax=Cacopsylla melanoneura TaxID=428564 RepID=A0A8D9B363_9HEMI
MDGSILSKSRYGEKDKKCKGPSYPTIKNKKINMSKNKLKKNELKKLDQLINTYIVSQQLYQDVPSLSDVRNLTKKMKDAVSSQELEQVKQKLLSDIGMEELTYTALLDDTLEGDVVKQEDTTTRTPLSEFDSNSTAINHGANPRYSMELSPIPAYNSSMISYTNRHHNTSYTNRSNSPASYTNRCNTPTSYTNKNANTTAYSSTSSHSSTTSSNRSKNLSILNRSDAELSDVFSKLTIKKSTSREKSKGRRKGRTARDAKEDHHSLSDDKENLETHSRSRRSPKDDVLHGTQRRAASQRPRPRTRQTGNVEMDDVEVKHEALNVSGDNIVERIDDLEDIRQLEDDTVNETTVSTRSQRAKRDAKASKDGVQTRTRARKPTPPGKKSLRGTEKNLKQSSNEESIVMHSMMEDTVVPNNNKSEEESSDEFYSQLEDSVLTLDDTKYEDAMDVTARQTRTRTRAAKNREDIENTINARKKETSNNTAQKKIEALKCRTTRKNIETTESSKHPRHNELNTVDSSIEDSDSENNNTIVKVDTRQAGNTRTKRTARTAISECGIGDDLKTDKQMEKTEIVDLTSAEEQINETVINTRKSPAIRAKPSSVTVKESPQILHISQQVVKHSPAGNRPGSDDPVVAFNRLLKNVTVRRGRKIVEEDVDCTVMPNVTSLSNNVNTTSSMMERSKVSLAPGKMWKRSLIDRSIRDRESHKFCRSFVSYSDQFSSTVSFKSRRSSLLSSRSTLSYSTTEDTLYETVLSSSTLYDDNEFCRRKILDICRQNDIVTFEDRYPTSLLKNCRKIGEGVYGEVFKLNDSVIKIMPIEGCEAVNGEDQKQFKEIFSEIMVTKETSDLQYRPVNSTPCFTELLKCSCVKGRYPDRLVTLWEEFAKTKKSYNDHPKMFDEEQVFIILELKNGGVDSGDIKYRSPNQTYSMILQVLFSLAVAEVELEFEHRDLHMSNILVSATESDETGFLLDDMTYEVKSAGVRPTIIDFTISRCFVGEKIMYYDLSQDEELFQGEGDYQFEMYRMMRSQCG